MTAADQLTRLLSLAPYLQARPGARIADVAREFGVTERQLLKDLNLMWFCGLPGHLPGDLIEVEIDGDRVSVSNADTIGRPLRLGRDEALALLVALRALEQLPGLHDRNALDRTLAKLERAAGDSAAGSGHVEIRLEAEEAATVAVREALARGRLVHLSYYVPGRDETTERDVDPMRLVLADGRPYLEGWCRQAEGVRLFRLDRVAQIEVQDAPSRVPAEARPRDLDAGLFQPGEDDEVVTLLLEPAGRWVADYYPFESSTEESGGRLRLTLRTPDTRWVRRLALRLGPTGRVVDPPQLAAQIRADAQSALAAYGEAPSVTPVE